MGGEREGCAQWIGYARWVEFATGERGTPPGASTQLGYLLRSDQSALFIRFKITV